MQQEFDIYKRDDGLWAYPRKKKLGFSVAAPDVSVEDPGMAVADPSLAVVGLDETANVEHGYAPFSSDAALADQENAVYRRARRNSSPFAPQPNFRPAASYRPMGSALIGASSGSGITRRALFGTRRYR